MNIVITGGGTGGHLYPGLELAKHFYKNGNKVFYIASKNGVDKDIIKSQKDLEKINIKYWDLKGFNRKKSLKSLLENSINAVKLIFLLNKAKRFLKTNNIDLVIGVGGYISYPIVKKATTMKIPSIIHEQNSYPGLVNRKLSDEVDYILSTYEHSQKYFNKEIILSSNPRVDETFKYLNNSYKKELGLSNKKIALFLGGSLGAKTINDLFLDFISSELSKQYQAILVSGLKNNEIDKNVDLKDNIVIQNTSELLKYISSSDIVISRAGATTLLEIVYLEKKSIIIPSYNVVANHQHANADEFNKKGLITLLDEKELNYDRFLKEFKNLENNAIISSNLKSYKKISSLKVFDDIVEEINAIK